MNPSILWIPFVVMAVIACVLFTLSRLPGGEDGCMEASTAWLNGCTRIADEVLVGNALHCIGCGAWRGTITVVLDESASGPCKEPSWPFASDDCPLCWLREQIDCGPEDKLTKRLLLLKTSRRTGD